ncbi:MAG: MBL fold metallo-hydrolase [Pseudomonadota bacterium]|nr:MBL fold metallo-hydrolase [Pseudomonadota bacterium]
MRLLSIFFLLIIISIPSNSETTFTNTDGQSNNRNLSEILKWSFNRESPIPEYLEVKEIIDPNIFQEKRNYAFWIGHASFLVSNGNVNILFDPIFSERASPLKFAGPKRLIRPATNISSLPKIDIIAISHNHYDHLDIESLKKIQNKYPNVKILIPKGDGKLLKKHNLKNGKEFLWWESIKIKETTLTFTPSQHWSARGLGDRNKSLWGSWHVKHDKKNIFHAGDTGYSEDFKEIHKRLGNVDFAMIPIGAYAPRWFMGYSHVNPEEAIKIAIDLNAKESVGMHWGTFILTDEPVLEPKKELNKLSIEKDINFYTVLPGTFIDID